MKRFLLFASFKLSSFFSFTVFLEDFSFLDRFLLSVSFNGDFGASDGDTVNEDVVAFEGDFATFDGDFAIFVGDFAIFDGDFCNWLKNTKTK